MLRLLSDGVVWQEVAYIYIAPGPRVEVRYPNMHAYPALKYDPTHPPTHVHLQHGHTLQWLAHPHRHRSCTPSNQTLDRELASFYLSIDMIVVHPLHSFIRTHAYDDTHAI